MNKFIGNLMRFTSVVLAGLMLGGNVHATPTSPIQITWCVTNNVDNNAIYAYLIDYANNGGNQQTPDNGDLKFPGCTGPVPFNAYVGNNNWLARVYGLGPGYGNPCVYTFPANSVPEAVTIKADYGSATCSISGTYGPNGECGTSSTCNGVGGGVPPLCKTYCQKGYRDKQTGDTQCCGKGGCHPVALYTYYCN
jgi:hypothetical protein